jgi:dihydrofolate synthase / folylpolyglutamate synthase
MSTFEPNLSNNTSSSSTAIDSSLWTLLDWLAHCERQHPKGISGIELGLDRVREVAKRLDLKFNCPIFMVAGTNGKGSTCAMLEAVLGQSGYRTGVYTSPHLVHFEERCRWQGEAVAANSLVPHFAAVEAARGDILLTYFEFTTLAIFLRLMSAEADVLILEVGLGGRLDAVNILDADCSIITSVDLDHMEFLGPDRESIGREKAGIMRANCPVIVSDPMPPKSVIEHAQSIGADQWLLGIDFNFSGDKQQWAWAGRGRRYAGLAYPALRGANQLLNAAGVLAALEAMRPRLPVTAQAIRNGLGLVDWPGRFQIIPGEPVLVLDVAHNPHAVAALAENLDAMGFYANTHAVFGAMADKDLTPMLTRMAPLVDHWYFCDLDLARAATAIQLQARWQALNIRPDATSSTHSTPQAALDQAVKAARPTDRIIVFGSFHTVGGVLQQGVPRLGSKHMSA